MKEAAQFMLDFLVEDPQGRLVTNPSHSPENSFRKADGTQSSFTYAATMDLGTVGARRNLSMPGLSATVGEQQDPCGTRDTKNQRKSLRAK